MRAVLQTVLLVLLLCSCAAFAPSRDEIALVKQAHEKLAVAKETADRASLSGLKAFRDELIVRSVAEVDQAALDEIGVASKDGLEEAEIRAISKRASELRAEALKHINAGYDKVADNNAKREFDELYSLISAYWMAKLDTESQKVELISKIYKEGVTNGVR